MLHGCGGYEPQDYMVDKETKAREEAKENTQLANPASIHCMNNSGVLTFEEDDSGTYGVCTFPDGSWCEEWAFFRGECEPGTNLTTCEGKFWGKSVCPAEYEPVCAKLAELDVETGEVLSTQQKEFNSACYACTYSKESMTTIGYAPGECVNK